ncbi:hypothetical protein D3C80_1470300 [compost metagenome]
MRVAGQQWLGAFGAVAGNHPGVAALELWQAIVGQRLFAQAGEGVQVFPVINGQCGYRFGMPLGQHAFGLPVEVEDVQVVGAQLVANKRQQGFSAKCCGKAVRHVTGDADAVFGRERTFMDAQHVELGGRRMCVLILIDAVQIGFQGLPCRRLAIQRSHVARGTFADAQAAKQFVGVDQFRAEVFRQFTTGQAPHGFHLE